VYSPLLQVYNSSSTKQSKEHNMNNYVALTNAEWAELSGLESQYAYAKKGSVKMALAAKMKAVYARAEARQAA
jgi:hypothetical protein